MDPLIDTNLAQQEQQEQQEQQAQQEQHSIEQQQQQSYQLENETSSSNSISENYLIESLDITENELFKKFYKIIQEKLVANNYNYSITHILIWTTDNAETNWYDEVYYGFCEDCNNLGLLRWEDACADDFHCCTKLICRNECLEFCSCGNPVYYNNNGYILNNIIMCSKCGESIPIHFVWWGLSPRAHIDKYG